jgi:hypothetical protein
MSGGQEFEFQYFHLWRNQRSVEDFSMLQFEHTLVLTWTNQWSVQRCRWGIDRGLIEQDTVDRRWFSVKTTCCLFLLWPVVSTTTFYILGGWVAEGSGKTATWAWRRVSWKLKKNPLWHTVQYSTIRPEVSSESVSSCVNDSGAGLRVCATAWCPGTGIRHLFVNCCRIFVGVFLYQSTR